MSTPPESPNPRPAFVVPDWVWLDPLDVRERMLALTYRVARRMGRSRHASARLCRRVFSPPATMDVWDVSDPAVDGPLAPRFGRRLRARLVTEVRAQWGRRHRDGLEGALREAVLLDELALLPPRQRFALWATTLQGRSVAEIAAHTGWTPAQIARLVRSALTTLTIRTRY
ncbi:sigma factor-like helix-turn-helix DNA-binding protein [Amycolatopsis sp. H20-H5]|uniref:sigma factor-like helix-turn-helix DNA-binding protein n=1 Tax=Amycolatopsis sp. H20-H5 TaxID=3046309 RepID=UPI002DBEB92B|nr:sigma factor-like helix-turn-helix DNA-binding protein [Amycolatopsis sp. H20-H5]MEC3980370.1 sigma factor-like helix-turn-helix DNA-binding protein [Amycolatopsis sp. H20-H5]